MHARPSLSMRNEQCGMFFTILWGCSTCDAARVVHQTRRRLHVLALRAHAVPRKHCVCSVQVCLLDWMRAVFFMLRELLVCPFDMS